MDKDAGFTQAYYERFRDLVLQRSGLNFAPDKRQMLVRGVSDALAGSRCANLDAYYELLRTSPGTDAEWDRLVGVLTVGETYFFRHQGHFDALTKRILPEIIAQRQNTTRRIRIWSAGCATGEEPYSLAVAVRELLPTLSGWNILILATDINRAALHKAMQGRYGSWSFRGVEKRMQERYFRLDDGKQYVISEEIKHMVSFAYLNLVEDHFPSLTNNTQGMDVIFCRNVTIYFTPALTQQVVGRFSRCLVDGGWLIPGAAEPNMLAYADFEQRNFPGAVIFQRSRQAARAAKPIPNLAAPLGQPVRKAQVAVPVAPTRLPGPQGSAPAGGAAKQPAVAQATDPYDAALALLEAGQTDEAWDKLQEKLRKHPDFGPAYWALGRIYANRGNLEEAQHSCERALEKDKLLTGAYYTLSMIYQERGVLDKALECLKKTVYLDSGFALAHYNLAHLYRQMGNMEQARRSLQNARRLAAGMAQNALIPEGDGLGAGRLLQLVEAELADSASERE